MILLKEFRSNIHSNIIQYASKGKDNDPSVHFKHMPLTSRKHIIYNEVKKSPSAVSTLQIKMKNRPYRKEY